jgi:hypothetical protein
MKFASSCILLAFVAVTNVQSFVPTVTKTTTTTTKTTTTTTLKQSSYNPMGQQSYQMPPAANGPMGSGEFFPLDIPMKRIEGGGTVRTWDIPPETERLQYVVETNGRPLKAKVELYVMEGV